jgi:hypothetical protein
MCLTLADRYKDRPRGARFGQQNYLQCSWTLIDDLGSVSQGPRRLVLTFGRDYLGTGLSSGLGLSSHGPLQLLRQPHILSA